MLIFLYIITVGEDMQNYIITLKLRYKEYGGDMLAAKKTLFF